MRSLNTFAAAIAFFSFAIVASLLFSHQAHAQFDPQFSGAVRGSRPAYYPYVIALPQDRQWIRNMPIDQRPTRPLHIYGNRVRQSYTVGPSNRSLPTSRATGVPLFNRR